MREAPRVVAVTPGPPRAPETFSGTSVGVLEVLDRRGALAGAVDARTRLLPLLEKAASVSPDMERWKQRYNAGASPISPLVRQAMSAIGTRRAADAAPDANVLLQLTGYFDPVPKRAGVLRCSYHDGNLAGYLRRADLRLSPEAAGVRKAVAYEQSMYDSIDLIFTMSERLRQSFIDDFGQAPDKVVTVGAGANVTAPEHTPPREPGPPRLLFVGKQFERKGGPTVVAAFERLRAEQPDAELWIVGPTGLELDVPGVTVHGRISREEPGGEHRIAELYERATAFVMPSIYEPLGIAILEAMAYRLPCVGSRAGAIPELIVEGETGFLIEPGDSDDLLGHLRTLAGDHDLAQRIGAAGFERYKRGFTWDSVVDRMLAAIDARRSA